MYKHLIISTIV